MAKRIQMRKNRFLALTVCRVCYSWQLGATGLWWYGGNFHKFIHKEYNCIISYCTILTINMLPSKIIKMHNAVVPNSHLLRLKSLKRCPFN